jgi:FkbM family methyltransferase
MLVLLLDRPGGRTLLGKIGTNVVRRSGAGDVEIVYRDGFWTRRSGPYYFPDSPKFEYKFQDFSVWPRQMERYIADAHEYWLRHYQPKEGDVIVDVGAGHGEDTVAFSRSVGKTGRVIAIEADPLSFRILERFCGLNRLTNVTLLHLALTSKPGVVRLVESKSSWMENTIDNSGANGIPVKADTLDHVCARLHITEIAFLKMNIEGAERDALHGLDKMLPRIQQICIACHDFRSDLGHGEQFRTRRFVEQFLVTHGFTLDSRKDDPRDYVRDHVFGIRCNRLG